MHQPDLFNAPVKELHRPGQETSALALTKHTKKRRSFTAKVFAELKLWGYGGSIPEHMAEKMRADTIDVRRAFSVLKKLGKIEATGAWRSNPKGNACEVWRVKK